MSLSLFRNNSVPLRWRHNERDSVSNHQTRDCFLNRLFRCRSKKRLKLRVTGLCTGNSPWTGEFPAQMASNAENVSIWWRYHASIMNKVTAGAPGASAEMNPVILRPEIILSYMNLIRSDEIIVETTLELWKKIVIGRRDLKKCK